MTAAVTTAARTHHQVTEAELVETLVAAVMEEQGVRQ